MSIGERVAKPNPFLFPSPSMGEGLGEGSHSLKVERHYGIQGHSEDFLN